MSADDYNEAELAAGRLKPAHVSELVSQFQQRNGLAVDGKAGPQTRALIEQHRASSKRPPPTVPVMRRDVDAAPVLAPLTISDDGWLAGAAVEVMPIHASWYYKRLSTTTGRPLAIVAHYTATDHGTARNMARNRANPLKPGDRQASWHVSIEGDGSIVQMAPLLAGCWHAGGPTAKPIPGIGAANRCAIGIELVGHGDAFPGPQVSAACRVWRAIVREYEIARERAMVGHSELDPTRKADPGKLWTTQYAPGVLEYAFG